MKFDWELFMILIGLVFLLDVPILLYIPSPGCYIMTFALGVVLTGLFIIWGMKEEDV